MFFSLTIIVFVQGTMSVIRENCVLEFFILSDELILNLCILKKTQQNNTVEQKKQPDERKVLD